MSAHTIRTRAMTLARWGKTMEEEGAQPGSPGALQAGQSVAESFRPWVADLWMAAICASVATMSAALAMVLQLGSLPLYGTTTSVTFTLAALYFLRRLLVRIHGQHCEQQALDKLQKLLTSTWSLQRNVPLQFGDLDGLLAGPDSKAFALEIKSKVMLKIIRGSLWKKDRLVDARSGSIHSSFFSQAKKNAQATQATPVLWFPNAKTQGHSKNIEQVIVVCGPPRYLLKVLRVPRKHWWNKS